MGKETALRSIIFRFERIQSLTWDNGPAFKILVQAQNSTNQSFTINSIAGNAYSDGVLVGNISAFDPFAIYPTHTKDFYITIKLNLINTVTQLIEAFQYGHFKKEITIKAIANVDTLPIRIEQTLIVGQ